MNRGTLAAIGAYGLWGVLPVYWKLIQTVPAIEILFHRMIWSLLFLIVLLSLRNQWQWFTKIWRDRRVLISFTGSALLLAINWFTYIYAVNSNHVVEASLGYFINPLLNVLLGVFILRERPRRWQWVAIGIAGLGVLYLTIQYGQLPWISLTLAITFALYGLLRKTAPLGSLSGLSLEMMFLFLPALGFLIYFESAGVAHFGHARLSINLLLAFTGVATALPLLLFAYGAQRVMLSTIGILQYTAPTLQFLLGVFVYKEPFDTVRLIGFVLVWSALIIYSTDMILLQRNRRRAESYAVE
ncbi:MAG TPA: EamA family transporter RarD [bacterium]|nr:EamA family transporter RarD [bacterium]